MIEVKNIVKTYRSGGKTVRAVDDVSLTVGDGEMVAVIGHSGSGKTTLLSLIGGLTRPDSGLIALDGTDIWSMDDDRLSELRNRKIGFVYQFSSLVPTLTALENVLLPTVFGSFSKEAEEHAKELLDRMGLRDQMGSYPSQLSGGQQRRVAIARAFINNPEIILADEPTGDLDEETEAETVELFKKMNRKKGIAFLIVTHSSELARNAARQLKMQHGSLFLYR